MMHAEGAPHAGDLADAVQAGERHVTEHRAYLAQFGADAVLAEPGFASTAVEGEHADRRRAAQPGHRLSAGLPGPGHQRVDVGLHQPDKRTLWHVSEAGHRTVGDIT